MLTKPRLWMPYVVTVFALVRIDSAQVRKTERKSPESPAVQKIAAEYLTQKYHVTFGEAQRRLALQDKSAGIEDDLIKSLGDQFAGIWFDHSDRGRLKIGMTRKARPKTAEVRAILQRYGVGREADLVSVQFTLAEIEQKQNRVRDSITTMVSEAHALTSYDTKANRVVVKAIAKLPPEEETRIRELASVEGVVVRRIDVPTLQTTFNFCNPRTCNAPLRGGMEILVTIPGFQPAPCTAAFMARHRQTGDLLVMTAGHCIFVGGLNNTWNANDETITSNLVGPSYGFVLGGDAGQDEGVVKVNPTSFWANPSPMAAVIVMQGTQDVPTAYDPSYDIRADSLSTLGRVLCRTGRTTNTHCAEVSALGADETTKLNIPGGSTQIFIDHQMGELDMCYSEGGDSGGPVYKSHRAFGIYSSGADYGPAYCIEIYQGIRGAEAMLNVDILRSGL